MRNSSTRVLMWALLAAGGAAHAQGDPAFGPDGTRTFGFQGSPNGSADIAYVACPGPGDTRLVIGEATNGERIVSARVRSDGTLDPTFSVDGKETFPLPVTTLGYGLGLCLADGGVLLARSHVPGGAGIERDIQLVRVRADGLPDPGFGGGDGVVALDLDNYASLSRVEDVLGLNLLSDGSFALVGQASIGDDDFSTMVGFAARIGADGSVLRVAFPDPAGVTEIAPTALLPAPGGGLWLIGTGVSQTTFRRSWFRVTLDAVTLQPQMPALSGSDPNADVLVGRGFLHASGVAVLAATRDPAGAAPQPQALMLRADGGQLLALPARSTLDGRDIGADARAHALVAARDGDAVLVAAGLAHADPPYAVAYYVARLLPGATAAADRVDTTFGDGGALVSTYRVVGGCTASPRPRHRLDDLSTWLGRPLLVGSIDVGCSESDYAITRLRGDYAEASRIFRDGYEGRPDRR
jgi:hypothetical protein